MGPHGQLQGQAQLGASGQGATVGRRLQSVSGSEQGKRGTGEGSYIPPGIRGHGVLPGASSMSLARARGRTTGRSQQFCYPPAVALLLSTSCHECFPHIKLPCGLPEWKSAPPGQVPQKL